MIIIRVSPTFSKWTHLAWLFSSPTPLFPAISSAERDNKSQVLPSGTLRYSATNGTQRIFPMKRASGTNQKRKSSEAEPRQKNLNNAASTTCFANHVFYVKDVMSSANAPGEYPFTLHHPVLKASAAVQWMQNLRWVERIERMSKEKLGSCW